MKRKYYLIIVAAVLATVVVLSMLNYTTLQILYAEYFNPHNINVFFVTKNGKLLQNVSVSLFAFYPTPNGTVIKEIYHGHNLKYLSIPVSNLTWYAKQWLGTYNYTVLIPNGTSIIKKHILYNASLIIPSLIGFASYYVVNQSNGTITIYTQAFSVRVSPYNITHGIGKTVFKVFLNPIVKRIKINESNSSTSSNAVNPQHATTTTITTTVPTQTSTGYPLPHGATIVVTYNLTTYWIYPSNSSQLGPIPFALAYVTDPNSFDYVGAIKVNEYVSSKSGISISFGITLFSSLSIQIVGTSITFSSGNASTSEQVQLGKNYHNFAEIYAWGQVAIANYTVYVSVCYNGVCGPPINKGNVTMYFFTALKAVGEKGAYVPALYSTNKEIPPSKSNSTIQTFFTEKLVPSGIIPPNYSSNIFGPYILTTSQGYAGPGIPVWSLIQLSLRVFSVPVPSWITLVVSPNIVIVPFSSYEYAYEITFAFAPISNNTYYVYQGETSVPYNIGGKEYNIPTFYFFIIPNTLTSYIYEGFTYSSPAPNIVKCVNSTLYLVPAQQQSQGLIFWSGPYTPGNNFTIQLEGSYTTGIWPPADGYEFYLFLTPTKWNISSYWNESYNFPAFISTAPEGTEFSSIQGEIALPQSSTPYIMVQWDPFWQPLYFAYVLDPPGGQWNIWIVYNPNGTNPNVITYNGIGNGFIEPHPNDTIIITVTYYPQNNTIVGVAYDINTGQKATVSLPIPTSYFAPPATPSYYVFGVGGNTGDWYANWMVYYIYTPEPLFIFP